MYRSLRRFSEGHIVQTDRFLLCTAAHNQRRNGCLWRGFGGYLELLVLGGKLERLEVVLDELLLCVPVELNTGVDPIPLPCLLCRMPLRLYRLLR